MATADVNIGAPAESAPVGTAIVLRFPTSAETAAKKFETSEQYFAARQMVEEVAHEQARLAYNTVMSATFAEAKAQGLDNMQVAVLSKIVRDAVDTYFSGWSFAFGENEHG